MVKSLISYNLAFSDILNYPLCAFLKGGGWRGWSGSAADQQEVSALSDLTATGTAHVPRRWEHHQRFEGGGAEPVLPKRSRSCAKPMWIWVPFSQRVTEEPSIPGRGEYESFLWGFFPPPQYFYCAWSIIIIFSQLYHEETDDTTQAASSHWEEFVRLTRLYQFARNVRALLHTYHYNQIFLTEFHGAYNKFTGCSLDPRFCGYTSVDELLSAIPQV